MNSMNPRKILGLALGVVMGISATAADVREGLVAYWPLDALSNGDSQTLDVVSTNNMTAVGFSAAQVVPGKNGNAFSFPGGPDGDAAARYLYFQDPGLDPITGVPRDTLIPVANGPALTVAYWVKGKGTGQNDRKVVAMSSSVSTDPLYTFGTHSGGTDDSFDLYVRNGGNPVNHFRSGTPFDDAWHHVAWTDQNGVGLLYIDGVLNTNLTFVRPPAPIRWDIMSIGCAYRPSTGILPQVAFTGLIDDVAVWERALSASEVQDVFSNGIAVPVPKFPPSISVQPTGSTNLLVGDDFTLRSGAIGTRPFTELRWYKGAAALMDATNTSLAFKGLQTSDSGAYTFVVSNGFGAVTSVVATLLVSSPPAPDLTNNLVAYWPLNTVEGTKTPDLANGYDMTLINMSSTNIVPGKWGNAMKFYAASASMMERENLPEDALSIYSKSTNFTVSLWVNGPGPQQDKRIFSESSSTSAQPLFNLGTHNGNTDGTIDSFVRSDTGATGNHIHSLGTAYDNTWHHVVYVQKELGGVTTARLFIDGVIDPGGTGQPDPRRPLSTVITSIGGVRRGAAAAPSRQFTFEGLIDDVAIWSRSLSAEEILKLYNEGTPTPIANTQPLVINRFRSDLPAVALGSTTTLRWDVSKDVTAVTIDQGIGTVLPSTVVGIGSVDLIITNTTTYTLIATRGAESLTNRITVAAIGGIASNWSLLENFDRYPEGNFTTNGFWSDPQANTTITNIDGNKLLDMGTGSHSVILQLQKLAISEGQTRTLFARAYVARDPALAMTGFFGVTDRAYRFWGDNNDAGGFGPAVIPSTVSGSLMFGANYGAGNATVDTAGPVLGSNVVYNVWIDITNGPLIADVETGDMFSVWVQKYGDSAPRELILQDYISNRSATGDPATAGGTLTRPTLDKLIVGNNSASSLFFDDFYISTSGLNSTVPRPYGLTTPIGLGAPELAVGLNTDKIRITYSNGTLQSAPDATGPWNDVPAATSPYETTPTGTQQFFQVKQ
jgi:hypothetical protein